MPVNGCDNGDVFSRNSHISLEGLLFSAGTPIPVETCSLTGEWSRFIVSSRQSIFRSAIPVSAARVEGAFLVRRRIVLPWNGRQKTLPPHQPLSVSFLRPEWAWEPHQGNRRRAAV